MSNFRICIEFFVDLIALNQMLFFFLWEPAPNQCVRVIYALRKYMASKFWGPDIEIWRCSVSHFSQHWSTEIAAILVHYLWWTSLFVQADFLCIIPSFASVHSFPWCIHSESKPALIPESLFLSEVVFITVVCHVNGAEAMYWLQQVKLLHGLEAADTVMIAFMYLETVCSSKGLLISF